MKTLLINANRAPIPTEWQVFKPLYEQYKPIQVFWRDQDNNKYYKLTKKELFEECTDMPNPHYIVDAAV